MESDLIGFWNRIWIAQITDDRLDARFSKSKRSLYSDGSSCRCCDIIIGLRHSYDSLLYMVHNASDKLLFFSTFAFILFFDVFIIIVIPLHISYTCVDRVNWSYSTCHYWPIDWHRLTAFIHPLPTPTMSVGVGRIFESVCLSVCLFVWSITQKRMIPMYSNLVYGMT